MHGIKYNESAPQTKSARQRTMASSTCLLVVCAAVHKAALYSCACTAGRISFSFDNTDFSLILQ